MKNIILVGVCLLFSSLCFSQEEWKPEEIEVLDRFGLEKNDSRGIVLYSGIECTDGKFSDIKSAVETFLTASLKKDLSEYCIVGISNEDLVGVPLDIHQIVKLYLENN